MAWPVSKRHATFAWARVLTAIKSWRVFSPSRLKMPSGLIRSAAPSQFRRSQIRRRASERWYRLEHSVFRFCCRQRSVGLGHGNLGAMLLRDETKCFAFLAGHDPLPPHKAPSYCAHRHQGSLNPAAHHPNVWEGCCLYHLPHQRLTL